MSAYEPPSASYLIFDSLVFQAPNNGSLTIAEGDARYLGRTNVATSIATATQFSGDISVGNGMLEYINGDGFYIKGTANGEAIYMHTLSAGGAILQKIELNPTNMFLYDAIRITDSSAPTNYTLLQQSTTTLNVNNQIAGSTTNFLTKTAGGGSVTPLSLSSTTSTFNLPIILQTNTPTNTAGYLGSFSTVNTNAVSMTTSTNTTLSGSFTIPAGVYLINFYANYNTNAVAGNVSYFSMGLSTALASFVGGTGEVFIGGSASFPAATSYFLGHATVTLSVPAGGTTFYIVGRVVFTGPTVLSTTAGYARYTRIA